MTTRPPIATRAVALATASKAAATKTTKIHTCHCGRSCWLLGHQGMQMVIPAKMIRAIEFPEAVACRYQLTTSTWKVRTHADKSTQAAIVNHNQFSHKANNGKTAP